MAIGVWTELAIEEYYDRVRVVSIQKGLSKSSWKVTLVSQPAYWQAVTPFFSVTFQLAGVGGTSDWDIVQRTLTNSGQLLREHGSRFFDDVAQAVAARYFTGEA